MLLFLLIGLGVGTALGASSAEDSEDTPSKNAAGFLKTRSAGRDISYSSSFGSEDFDSPDIPSDFHARWGINKTWGAKTPHPLLSRRASFEDYGVIRKRESSEEEESSEEQQSTSSEHGITSSHTKSPMTFTSNSLTPTKQTSEKRHQSSLKSTIQTPSSRGKQKTTHVPVKAVEVTRLPTEKVNKATQNRPASKQQPTAMTKTVSPQSTVTLKSTSKDNTETQKSSTVSSNTPPTVTQTTAHSTPSTTAYFLEYTTTVGQDFSTHHSLSTPVTTRFKTRTWGPPLPKVVPLLGVTFLVGGSAYMVYHISHSAIVTTQTT